MTNQTYIAKELACAHELRDEARFQTGWYDHSDTHSEDRNAATLALLACALEQECIAQGINPARYPIFTTGELE